MVPSKDGTATADKNTLLAPVAEDRQLTLQFSNINAWVPTEFQQPSLASRIRSHVKKDDAAQRASKRQILHHIGAEMLPGEVFSLMGPSGSGKSTLLSVISGRTPKSMTLKGDVLYNGQPLSKSIKKRIGFVLQDDVLYESLTVYETLYYAAMLRLPKDMSKEEKQQRVDSVLDSLGLRKCQDTIIGGFFMRGVSGGERKRVSIGHELLINPSILMLDEPTSGLDSTTAMHLLVVLRQLATGGRAVLTTIHQPSSRLYQQLDKLLLLAEGHAIYYGAADKVVTWFGHLGYDLPYGINVADFILDLAMGEELPAGKGAASGKDSIRGLWRTYEKFARRHPQGFHQDEELQGVELLPGGDVTDVEVVVVQSAGGGGECIGIDRSGREDGSMEASSGAPSSSGASVVDGAAAAEEGLGKGQGAMGVEKDGKQGPVVKEPRSGASYWDQLHILLVRSLKTRRFDSLSGQRFLQLVLVAVITGMFWWQKGGTSTTTAASDTIGLLFFELLFPAFSAMFSALFTFPNDYRMLLKERTSGMYQLSAYYIARVASDFPLDCTYPTLFCIIMYFMGGLRATPVAFFSNWLTLILVVLIAQSLGLFVGATCMDPKTAQTITTVIMLTFMLVGGYYVRGIPVWISWVKYISFIYWGFNLLIKIEFSDRTVYKCESGTCRPVSNVRGELNLPVNPDAGVWPEVVVLMGMLVVLRIAVYIALKKKTAS